MAGNVIAVVLLRDNPAVYKLDRLDEWVAGSFANPGATEASAIWFTVGLLAMAEWAWAFGRSAGGEWAAAGARFLAVTSVLNAAGTLGPLVLVRHVGADAVGAEAIGLALCGASLALDALFNLGLGVGLIAIGLGGITLGRSLRVLAVVAGAMSLPVSLQATWAPAAHWLAFAAPFWLLLVVLTSVRGLWRPNAAKGPMKRADTDIQGAGSSATTSTRRMGAAGLLVTACVLSAHRPAAADGIEADFEAGIVAASRNDVRIPGVGGTKLSLVDDLSASPSPVFRLRVGYRFAERHLITALYAPLRLHATGQLAGEVDFAGGTYPAGSSVLGVYRFDSYRLTYRYSFVRDETFEFAAGLTGKIRDAEVSLHGPRTARKTNTGFVPLLNLHFEWRPGGGAFGVVLDADALAAPQGRAEDVLLAATWAASDAIVLRVGYRMVEGGADNDEVYNFAWLHYAVSGVDLRF